MWFLGSDFPSCHPFGFGEKQVKPEIIPSAAPPPSGWGWVGRLKVKPHTSPALGDPLLLARISPRWIGGGGKGEDKFKDKINKL